MPAFDSDYVSLMVTAYDHYVNVPMTTRNGDFRRPEKLLFYTARTEGYKGEPVKGVDRPETLETACSSLTRNVSKAPGDAGLPGHGTKHRPRGRIPAASGELDRFSVITLQLYRP
jgi:hypothetical protein